MTKTQRYESLVVSQHKNLYRYALWLIKDESIAEDVVQETFLRAWRNLDALKDEAAAKSWLITILRRENARRFERKQFEMVDVDQESIVDIDLDYEDKFEHQALRQMMAELKQEYREPIMLQVLFGYTGEEIAALLGIKTNTVMTRLFRARSQLKDKLAIRHRRAIAA